MPDFRLLRRLSLDTPSAPDRPAYLSAASGLVRQGGALYVVADDELHLGIFQEHGEAPGRLLRLVDGELPASADERKRRKPDFEALTILPPFGEYRHGALFVLGSGSKRRRRGGALLALDAAGEVIGKPHGIDGGGLYDRLADDFDDLNIEGAAIVGAEFLLLHRGNKGEAANAVIRYALGPLLASLAGGDKLSKLRPRAIQRYELGDVDGVPLCFTDGAALAGGELVFTAVAENTDDSYRDGACAGAAVGLIDGDGRLLRIERLTETHKVEGLHAWHERDVIHLLAVTDADDPQVPAALLAAEWRVG